MEHAEDTLIRFIKSSVKLLRPAEVEQKRVELMVRELLTVRPYSTSGQLLMRRVCAEVRQGSKTCHTLFYSPRLGDAYGRRATSGACWSFRVYDSRSLHMSKHHKLAPFID